MAGFLKDSWHNIKDRVLSYFIRECIRNIYIYIYIYIHTHIYAYIYIDGQVDLWTRIAAASLGARVHHLQQGLPVLRAVADLGLSGLATQRPISVSAHPQTTHFLKGLRLSGRCTH